MRQDEAKDESFVVPIESIHIDETSRDDIPALLQGLKHLYVNEDLRQALFAQNGGHLVHLALTRMGKYRS